MFLNYLSFKRILYGTFLIIFLNLLGGCQLNTDKTAKVAPPGWIVSTKPAIQEVNVPLKSDIEIVFNQDMDANTLNYDNIIALEGLHSGVITNMFKYEYLESKRTLYMKFKDPESDYGPGNGITVTITGKVANKGGQIMGKDYILNFGIIDQ